MAPRLEIDRHTLRMIAIAFVLLSALTIHRLFWAEVPGATEALTLDGQTMGTTYQIRIAGAGLGESLHREVEAETNRRLDEVDRWLSDWNPESEVSRFNALETTEGFPVSFETAEVVAYAVELCKWSTGAFDITVGPLVSRWGFGAGAQVDSPPSDEEIATYLSRMGGRILRIGRGNAKSGGFLRKFDPKVKVDLSAIAKGYGVDHVAEGLFELGRSDFLVEIGGEVFAAGERPGGGPWRLGIEKPLEEGRQVQTIVELQDQGMATSGDYRIFYVENDQRISHTIDPRTGRPVENGPAAATVIAPSATEADAWATTLMVMGQEGLELAEQYGLGALILTRTSDGEIVEHRNSLFPLPRGAAVK
ncbi:MAG: FAD:protein FMN transferase [Myxococcota bacterium]